MRQLLRFVLRRRCVRRPYLRIRVLQAGMAWDEQPLVSDTALISDLLLVVVDPRIKLTGGGRTGG